MNWRIILAVGIAAVMALPATAMASHMGTYRNLPFEHDAQGVIAEPDGLSTSVLGPTVTNCILDLPPFEGSCTADPVPKPSGALGNVIAPGCTGSDGSRALTGQCGLWTVGAQGQGAGVIPAPASVQGMSGNAAPGAYTPTKGDTIRFLEGAWNYVVQVPNAPTNVVDLNWHLTEAERLTGEDLVVSRNALPGQNFIHVWYGQWTDRNGNGVVDHHQPGSAGPTANEFAFLGGCVDFNGARDPNTISRGLCIEDGNPNVDPPGTPCADPSSAIGCAGTTIHGWFFPGNHHGSGLAIPDDFHGQQVVTYALFGTNCVGPPTCDEYAADFFGDPLLDKQDEVNNDQYLFHDRTGDPGDTARQWAGHNGWAMYFHGDDGLLITMVQVYGVNCAATTGATKYVLSSCTFTDVDRQTTISPAAQELLVGDADSYPNGGLKGSARGAWLVVRDGAPLPTAEIQRLADSVANSEDVYLATQGPLQGSVDDLALQSGWSREPNTAGDVYVGVSHGACGGEAEFRGYCNVGGYAAYKASARGFFDVQLVRNGVTSVPVQAMGLPCISCIYGLGADLPYDPESVTQADVHARTLGPGQYYYSGLMGTWHDKATKFDESLYPDPAGTTMVEYGDDGWVGAVQRASGQWRYRGYEDRTCTTEKGLGLHTAAECNPYLDGAIEDPQDYTPATQGGEFHGTCNEAGLFLTLRPADGDMDTQILVWTDHGQGIDVDPLDMNGDGETLRPNIVAYGPGPVAPLVNPGACFGERVFQHTDFLIWAEGNRGDVIITSMTQSVALGYDVNGDGVSDFDTITDVDVYAPWN